METEIAVCCRRLRLSRNIAEISGRVEADSHQEYLLKILKQEVAYRETTRKNRLVKQAGFYSLKTFDGYCFDEIRLPAELSVSDLKDAAFIEQDERLRVKFPGGLLQRKFAKTGKSYLQKTVIGVFIIPFAEQLLSLSFIPQKLHLYLLNTTYQHFAGWIVSPSMLTTHVRTPTVGYYVFIVWLSVMVGASYAISKVQRN